MADFSWNKSVRERDLETLAGVEDLPWVVEVRRSFHQPDHLFDDCDNRLLEAFEAAHAGTIAEQQSPCRRVVALNNAYSQLTCPHGQD